MYIGIKEIISKCNFWILQWLRKPNAACLHQPLPKWTWYFCLLATTCKSGVENPQGWILCQAWEIIVPWSLGHVTQTEQIKVLLRDIIYRHREWSCPPWGHWTEMVKAQVCSHHLSYYLNLQDQRIRSIA